MNPLTTSKRYARLVFLFALVALQGYAQVPVSINSGNPSCPFPQFVAYENSTAKLTNLAAQPPVGVTHAEMEKSTREAYRIMMNRASKPGGGVGGIDYVYFKSTPDCTEGDGYAMLAAVAMADKPTFDGLWLWIHDIAMNKVKRYSDGVQSSPNYLYSRLPGWLNKAGDNSAADGDFDIGLALLCAYYQWGEFMGINDASGTPISYKQSAIEFLTAISDTLTYSPSGSTLNSGDIGLDGYFKGGDSWGELTDWAKNAARAGVSKPATIPGPNKQFPDYAAPAYFHSFGDFLSKTDSAAYAWNIYQFRRAEASSDWLMGQLFQNNQRNIPFAGQVGVDSTNAVTFTNFSMGEDFRLAWRTILNFIWNGNPASTWDPATHQIVSSAPNTFERDIGSRYARFLWDNRQAPWNNGCTQVGVSTLGYWGPGILAADYTVPGSVGSNFYHLNWVPGTGSISAVVSQDRNLMAELYRQCEIEWDVETPGDGYLTSVPWYYHGWFRLLGMLVLSGNYQAPSAIKPAANMKVYLDIDKTAAMAKDTVTYTVDYRNFGSLDASGVTIVDTLHPDFSFVSATGGGVYSTSANTVTWNIGSVPGFKTATGIPPTTGQVMVKVAVNYATQKQYRNRVSIACTNGSGWISNEFPNTVSAVMKRNYLDIVRQPVIDGTIETSSMALHGGRAGVHFSFSRSGLAISQMQYLRFRLYSDAQEAYINHGNYRLSYFMFDTLHTGLAGVNGVTNGWNVQTAFKYGIDNVTILHQNLTPGSDGRGKWNQRLIFQFSSPLNPAQRDTNWLNMSTTNKHLEEYRGNNGRIHRGQKEPLQYVAIVNPQDWSNIQWSDNWSWDSSAVAADDHPGFPITPDFTDPDPHGIPVTRLNPKHCDSSATAVGNILVEEWDGYVWRRVSGNYPAGFDSTGIRSPAILKRSLTVLSVNKSTINYSIAVSEKVSLNILDIRGRTVATLIDGFQKAGNYSIKLDRYRTGSSVYILRFVSGNRVYLDKIITIR